MRKKRKKTNFSRDSLVDVDAVVGVARLAGEVDCEHAVPGHDGAHLLGLDPGRQRVLAAALLLDGALGVGRVRRGVLLEGVQLEDVVGGEDDLDVVGREALEVAGELGQLAVVGVELAEAVGRVQVVLVADAAAAVQAVRLRDLEREHALVQQVLDQARVHLGLQLDLALELAVHLA